jgi:transposase-like protein
MFKAEAVGACQQPGVSIAAVALARRLNANLLRTWVRQAERSKAPIAIRATAPSVATERSDSFVPVALPLGPTESVIRVELRRKGRTMSLQWPASAARECALLLRELMK